MKTLVVGAGGIGCEVIKSLAIDGNHSMYVIDFDTVSLSNLSRQFFYSEKDIGEEKAITLAKNCKRLYPDVDIIGSSMDVLSDSFSVDFVSQFGFVFCCVDNNLARARVNTICVFLRIYLIDCGSSGRLAQSVPVLPFKSACYSCSPAISSSGPKVTCTIRSHPESFEHCAAWAFHLFDAVFSGKSSNDIISLELSDPQSLYKEIFTNRINNIRTKLDIWKDKSPPDPILIQANSNQEPISRPTDIWTDDESVSVILYILSILSVPQVFDKDNQLHLAFTTAATNLQALAYHISKRASMFEAKGLVSVVEPSLATTNSIISSVAVKQMKNIISDVNVKSVWLSKDLRGPRLTPTSLEPLNPKCPVCGNDFWELVCDYETTKLSDICNYLNLDSPTILYGKRVIYDYEDGNDRTLSDVGIIGSSIVNIIDSDSTKNLLIKKGTFSINIIWKALQQKKCSQSDNDYSDIEIL